MGVRDSCAERGVEQGLSVLDVDADLIARVEDPRHGEEGTTTRRQKA